MERTPGNRDAPASEDQSLPPLLRNWILVQDSLKKRLVTEGDFSGKLFPSQSPEEQALKYVGGVDVSFSKHDPSIACGCLVVLDFHSLQLLCHDYATVNLQVPYVPGFLAFREAPVLLQLLDNMKKTDSPFYPQVLMVDGNGLLHPRGFGLASHIGVLANLPTIGIGKNLHHVDGLTQSGVRRLLEAEENRDKDLINLVGSSGFVWGVAMRSTQGSLKPIFVSIGHRLSLDTAIMIVKMTCKYRVPEPVRQADIRSREHLQKCQTRTLERCKHPNMVVKLRIFCTSRASTVALNVDRANSTPSSVFSGKTFSLAVEPTVGTKPNQHVHVQ
ncbi:hypothetical protein SLA2020_323810 [Shorea laevis]